jgi:nucleoside-diphosphate-sugar epimerase
MKIGVIGSNGLVGSAICEELVGKYHVVEITRDTYSSCVGGEYDIIINANGNSSKWFANENPGADFISNVESVNFTMTDFKFKKYIYISSYDVARKNVYGFHKKLAETIVKNYTDYIILRCPIVIGEGMKKGFLYDIVNNIPLYVDAKSEYQVITNTELAKIVKTLIEKKASKKCYNVGSVDTLKIGDLAKILNKKIKYRANAKHEHYENDVNPINKIYETKTAGKYIREIV